MAAPVRTPPTQADIIRRRRWAYGFISRASSPPPAYGSAAWFDLPEGSPERIASVVIAAEAWAMDDENIKARLAVEIEAARVAFKRSEDEAYLARSEAHRESAPRPGKSFLERRRAQLDVAQPRPGDHLGRSS